MSNDITFMDCWGIIAPLLPVSTDFERGVYVMVFHALMKEAEKRRIAESWGKQFAGGGKTGGQNDDDQH